LATEDKTRQEAVSEASKAEIQQVLDKDTLTPIVTPADGTPEMRHVSERMLNLFMINSEKFTATGQHDKFKSRWVINGNPQSPEGYDPKSLSAPTPSDCIILLFIAIAAKLNWKLNVIDVAGAFLNSNLVKGSAIYARIARKQVPLVLEIRPNWKRFINARGDILCKVEKGLYGLKESPSLWSIHIADTLTNEAGYTQNSKESCVFSRGSGPTMSILIVFVDDILVLSMNDEEFGRLQLVLKNKYGKITTKSGVKIEYLGMAITQVRGGFEVTQTGSIEKILNENDIKGVKPAPGNHNFVTVFEDSPNLADAEFTVFRSIVMSLLYLARRTRPDVLFHVSWLTTRMKSPTQQDLRKLHHVLQYLNGTRNVGLRLVPRDEESGLTAMVDSSHGLHQTGHGHWGLCIFFYGMCVLCVSRKLKLVCRSSCESEMLGVNEGGVYVLFIRELLSTLGINQENAITVFQDNESAIGIMSGNNKMAMTSKHISLRNLWIRDQVNRSEIKFEHRKTKFMTADILGKGLVGHLFKRHRYGVMNWASLKPEDDSEAMYSLDEGSLKFIKNLID
jgi:hypothetical protein